MSQHNRERESIDPLLVVACILFYTLGKHISFPKALVLVKIHYFNNSLFPLAIHPHPIVHMLVYSVHVW